MIRQLVQELLGDMTATGFVFRRTKVGVTVERVLLGITLGAGLVVFLWAAFTGHDLGNNVTNLFWGLLAAQGAHAANSEYQYRRTKSAYLFSSTPPQPAGGPNQFGGPR